VAAPASMGLGPTPKGGCRYHRSAVDTGAPLAAIQLGRVADPPEFHQFAKDRVDRMCYILEISLYHLMARTDLVTAHVALHR
jgi:hypothetical protein